MIVSSMLCTNVRRSCLITPVNRDPAIVERIETTFACKSGNAQPLNKDYVGDDAIVRWVEDHAEPKAA